LLLVKAPDAITTSLAVEVDAATAPFTLSGDCSGWGTFSSFAVALDPPKPPPTDDGSAQLLPGYKHAS
jgi:hypothetical protein